MLKKRLYISLLLLAIPLFTYMIEIYQNNRDQPRPSAELVQERLERSTQWLLKNEAAILQQVSPLLWWMLYEAEKLSHDARISELLAKYKQRYPRVQQGPWNPLFGAPPRNYLAASLVHGLPYYNQHIIYALNCSTDIASDILVVKQQNQADFCHQPSYIYRPACITHQLLGINFLSTNNCGLLPNIDEIVKSLQDDIKLQLTLDTRVVDVYLQRVMVLLITGLAKEVKPVWIQRVLDHQLEDGGWSQFVALVPLGTEKWFGFGPEFFSINAEKSTFHTTAQGVLILTALLYGQASD